MTNVVRSLVLCLAVLPWLLVPAGAAEQMKVLAKVGPWPVVDHLTAYRGKLWFSASVKGRNHNSADIWSFEPNNRTLRHERHLFSQAAGAPLMHRGLLYWPYEDGRFSLGWGMIEVTNGEDWRPLLVPTAEIFHLHHLAELKGELLAVSSAWRAGYQLSSDGGVTWRRLYDHETPPRRVSRFTVTAADGGTVYSRLRERGGSRLVYWTGGAEAVRDVAGWPQGQPVMALISHRRAVYALTHRDRQSSIWRLKDGVARKLPAPAGAWWAMDLTSDGKRLWAVSRETGGGTVWRSADRGETWTRAATFSGGTPWSVRAFAGGIYVGGAGADGQGILWGAAPPGARQVRFPPPDLPRQYPSGGDGTDWQALGAELDQVMALKEAYENHGRGKLRDLVMKALAAGAPEGFLAARLGARFPGGRVKTFGGQLNARPAEVGRTMLLWAMGLAGQKGVPPELLVSPWTLPPNGPEKYFDPLLTAMWTIAVTRQRDRATIDALIARLTREDDPDWITSQAIGTLTAVTGKRFAYEKAAWRTWWESARLSWKP
ncbi:MAG: hypothetical protein AAF441_16605 [Pseudomonadota bacterium]